MSDTSSTGGTSSEDDAAEEAKSGRKADATSGGNAEESKPNEEAAKAETAKPAEPPKATDAGPGTAPQGNPVQETPVQETPVQETLHGAPLVDSLGAAVVHTGREGYGELMAALKADGYQLFVGLSGVDYLTHPGRRLPEGIVPERFEVVVELARVEDRSRLRVRCQVPASDPTVISLFDLWAGSEAHEREAYDMFGIGFEGHPDPSRILMPEDWEGHPLRKDYASGRIPVQFKEAPSGR